MQLTRTWQDAEILAMASALIDSVNGGNFIILGILLDGLIMPPSQTNELYNAGQITWTTRIAFGTLAPGPHTLALWGQSGLPAGNIGAGRAILTVIELPRWDSPANIITL
jgi:hypothetical protein